MGRLHTRYAPVRHSSATIASTVTVRLACIKPAASVHPEPGSNSPFYLMLFELSFFSLSRLYRLRPQKNLRVICYIIPFFQRTSRFPFYTASLSNGLQKYTLLQYARLTFYLFSLFSFLLSDYQ
jgi:hypothetical protein